MKIERKVFEIKGSSIDENQICGAANVLGIIDRGGDVVFPGFFTGALPGFRKNGFVPIGHDWQDLPVAMPTLAEERGNELYTEATFHSTQKAQDARIVAMERQQHGLSVGLSVGFSIKPDGYKWFPTGQKLLDWADENGCDPALFDRKGIAARKGMLRGLLPGGCDELYEYSVVPVPMNQESLAADVKSVCGSSSLPLASRDRAWSGTAAAKRLKGDDDKPSADYKKAHVVCDGPTDEFTSYKLPFADLIDGKLTAIPKGIFAVAGALSGSRGGVEISDDDRAGAKSLCERYYKKISVDGGDEIDVPWKDDDSETESGKSALAALAEMKSQYLGDVERSATVSCLNTLNNALMRVVYSALYGGEAESLDEMLTELAPAFDEFKDFGLTLIRALLENADWDAISEQSSPYYSYYSAPAEEIAALKFTEKAAALVTATEAFSSHASRIQELRTDRKAGRKFSHATIEQMQAIHDHLKDGCDKLSSMLTAENDAPGTDTASDKGMAATKAARHRADLLLRELKARHANALTSLPD